MPGVKDIWKLIEETDVDPHYAINVLEMAQIINRNGGLPLEIVNDAFTLGYAQGRKAEKAAARRKERET